MIRERFRIALVSATESPLSAEGQPDTEIAQMARALARTGCGVDMLVRREHPAQPASADLYPGVRVFHLDAGPPQPLDEEAVAAHLPEFIATAEKLLRHGTVCDVLYAATLVSSLAALSLKQSLGLPLIAGFPVPAGSLHDDEYEPVNERRVVRQADRVLAASPDERQELLHRYGADAGHVAVVPAGIDTEQFTSLEHEPVRERLGLLPGHFALLHVGGLQPEDGIDDVMRALGRLGSNMNAQLLVAEGAGAAADAGGGIERLRELAHRLGVSAQVRFLGRQTPAQLRACYCAVDVFVAAPWAERFGSASLQAMACGTPVIGSDVGAIPYTVADGVTGFLVKPHDPTSLSERLIQLHANPSLARAFGRAGTRRVRSLFSREQAARQLCSVVGAVMAEYLSSQLSVQSVPLPLVAARDSAGPAFA